MLLIDTVLDAGPKPTDEEKMRIPTLSVFPQSNSIQFLCKYIVMYQLDSKNLNYNIFVFFFRKMNIFWGMKILSIFLGTSQNWISSGVISMYFRVFS